MTPTVELTDPRFARRGLRLLVKRDDLIHPELPGNKWRKLHRNLPAAREQGHHTLLTFGGAYSGHLRATAAAGRLFGFATIGVVRGEEHLPLNPSLAYARAQGMCLTYLDRAAYRRKHEPAAIAELTAAFGDCYLIPEGGSNSLAVLGCAEIGPELTEPGVVCCPVGTGGTLAGLAAGLPAGSSALGFAVLKGGFLPAEVGRLQFATYGGIRGDWRVQDGFHCGGYARTTPELTRFVADFEQRHGLTLDPVYTGKMFYGLTEMADSGQFPAGTTVIALLTG